MRSVQRRRAGWIAAAAALAGLASAGALTLREAGQWTPARELWLARGTGWVALVSLALAVSATPLARVADRLWPERGVGRELPALRRAFGITAALLALVHTAIALGGWLGGAWAAVLSWAYLRAGLVAVLVLVVLLVTSFPPLVQRLRVRLWKPLHRLAYVAVLLVFQHLVLSPFAPRALTLTTFSVIVGVAALRLLPARSEPPR